MRELLGLALVIGGATAATAGVLALWVWALGRAEAREERLERERMTARHYGRDELP